MLDIHEFVSYNKHIHEKEKNNDKKGKGTFVGYTATKIAKIKIRRKGRILETGYCAFLRFAMIECARTMA